MSKHLARLDSIVVMRSSEGEDRTESTSESRCRANGVTARPKNEETSASDKGVTLVMDGGSGDRNSVKSRHFCLLLNRPGGLKKPSIRPKASSSSPSRHCYQASKTPRTSAGSSDDFRGQRVRASANPLTEIDMKMLDYHPCLQG